MLRLMVLSRTYRQSSDGPARAGSTRSQGALFARQPRWRLSAEAVRDNALAASGLSAAPSAGPASSRRSRPASHKKASAIGGRPVSGADRYRRGLYTFLQRTSPFAQFVTFDLPDTSRACTRRERSNTPLQAFHLLNDPVFVEAAQALAGA